MICIFFVIGWLVEQVKVLMLFNVYFKCYGLDVCVILFKIELECYCEVVCMFMKMENVGGIFVFILYKFMILEVVEQVILCVCVVGVCNVVYCDVEGVVWGDLIDGEGFICVLVCIVVDCLLVWNKICVLVVGIGGVGCVIVVLLVVQGVVEISVFDINCVGVEVLLVCVEVVYLVICVCFVQFDVSGVDLLVNCMLLGMYVGDLMFFVLEGVSVEVIVVDCGMKIEMSQLLVQVEVKGCCIQKGKEMFIEQVLLYFELFGWLGVVVDDFCYLEVL